MSKYDDMDIITRYLAEVTSEENKSDNFILTDLETREGGKDLISVKVKIHI